MYTPVKSSFTVLTWRLWGQNYKGVFSRCMYPHFSGNYNNFKNKKCLIKKNNNTITIGNDNTNNKINDNNNNTTTNNNNKNNNKNKIIIINRTSNNLPEDSIMYVG